ncbi:hypothetical protein V9L05_18130 [Bernardetia sp. Wsw4-3y2]|uniref:hypothetical protein n=1 Tax=Bernardetia sp. Wsw4-3y2 TaxID=3127471 RepID=UPI0030D1E168
MDNQELETTETAVSTEVQQEQATESILPTTNISMEARSVDDIANDLLELKSQRLDVATRSWSPLNVGEKKMMLFLGGGVAKMPSKDDPSVTVNVPYVEFLEAYKDTDEKPSLRKWRMTTTRITNMFLQMEGNKEEGFTSLSYKYATQTGWEIEFIGLVPSKKNADRKIMDFAIRVPQASK